MNTRNSRVVDIIAATVPESDFVVVSQFILKASFHHMHYSIVLFRGLQIDWLDIIQITNSTYMANQSIVDPAFNTIFQLRT